METKALAIPGRHGERVNVNAGERLVSVFAGGALAAAALKKRDWMGAAIGAGGAALIWRGISGTCPAYLAAGVNTAERSHTSQHTVQVFTIRESPEKLYSFWRNLENLPQVMHHVESVRILDDRRSAWRAKGPAGRSIEWEAVITNDVPNERIEWESTEKSTLRHRGSVAFRRAPGDRGTEVRLTIDYQPPGGRIGEGISKLMGRSVAHEAREDLRRFKQLMETGEIATIQGQPSLNRKSMFAPLSASRS